jgi:hypothetical protein
VCGLQSETLSQKNKRKQKQGLGIYLSGRVFVKHTQGPGFNLQHWKNTSHLPASGKQEGAPCQTASVQDHRCMHVMLPFPS